MNLAGWTRIAFGEGSSMNRVFPFVSFLLAVTMSVCRLGVPASGSEDSADDPTSQPVLLAILDHKSLGVNCVTFSPDGKILATVGADETIKLWDVKTVKVQATLKGHKGQVYSVAFSPNGKTLASAGEDKTIKLWDVKTGNEQATLGGDVKDAFSLAFSPDGKTLASAAFREEAIKLWDVKTGKERATLNGHECVNRSVAFSPNGKLLASGGWGKESTKLWHLPSPDNGCPSRWRE